MVKELENDLQTGLLDPLQLYSDTEIIKYDDATGSYDFIYQCDNQRLGSVLTNFSYQELLDAIDGRRKDANGVIAQLSEQVQSDSFKLLPKVGSLFHQVCLKPQVIEELYKRIMAMDRTKLPILIHAKFL